MKYRWRVSDKPVGKYKSFDKREWPEAIYENGMPAAHIGCYDEYEPSKVKTGEHAELTLFVADHSVIPWTWRTLKGRYSTLKQTKDALTRFLKKSLHYIPKE